MGLYRDATDGKWAYLRELHAEQARARTELPRLYARIRAARVARAAAGGVLAAAGAAMLVAALALFAQDGAERLHRASSGGLTWLLLGGWAAAAAVYAVARAAAWARFGRRLAAELAPSGDLDLDLERARRPVRQVAHGLVTRVERASVVWPLVGVSLVMPLTLHYLVALFVGGPGVDAHDFDQWIVASAILVGHCHLVVALRAYRFGRVVAETPEPVDSSTAGSRAWGMAVAASLMPGLILFAVPTLLVALTGVFIPILFAVCAGRIAAERDEMRGEALRRAAAH